MTNIFNARNLNSLKLNNKKLINEISSIHFQNLPNSFYTISGINFVKFFYELLLLSDSTNILISQEDDLTISGFIIWAPSNFSLLQTLIKNLFHFKMNNFKKIMYLFNYEVIKRIFSKMKTFSHKKKFPFNSSQIISIVVDKKYIGRGIGTKLVNKVTQECLQKDFDFLIATTTSYQKSAIKFYNSLIGFDLIYENKISSDYIEYTFSRILK